VRIADGEWKFMSKVLRSVFFGLGLAFLISAVSVNDANGQGVLGEVLRRMDLNNKSLQSIQANVTMVKHNPQLNVSDTYTGTTSYLPKTKKNGMYMRLDWAKPTVEQISVIGDDYELYKPSINQVYTGKVGKAKNSSSAGGALAFMSMSKDQLKQNYNISFLGEEKIGSGTQVAHILLTPKAAASYKTAELWVDPNGMPLQAKVTEQNNDTTNVLLENIRKNVTLNASIFKLAYDKRKVKVIKA
jgi:outer membrane lipoprotein-sorting protein